VFLGCKQNRVPTNEWVPKRARMNWSKGSAELYWSTETRTADYSSSSCPCIAKFIEPNCPFNRTPWHGVSYTAARVLIRCKRRARREDLNNLRTLNFECKSEKIGKCIRRSAHDIVTRDWLIYFTPVSARQYRRWVTDSSPHRRTGTQLCTACGLPYVVTHPSTKRGRRALTSVSVTLN